MSGVCTWNADVPQAALAEILRGLIAMFEAEPVAALAELEELALNLELGEFRSVLYMWKLRQA